MLKRSLLLAAALFAAAGSAAQAAPSRTFSAYAYAQPNKLIGAQAADQIALNAVRGGQVVLTQLDNQPAPLHYSVDILQPVYEYEVWVNAKTGAVINIIRGRR